MDKYDLEKPLISIHIPKCAGSSLVAVLKSWFGRGFRQHYHDEKKNRPPKKHNLYTGIFSRRFKYGLCIHGHFNNARGNGVDNYYPEIDQLITIIRDPFNLHLSNYFYAKQRAKNQGGTVYRSGKQHSIIENNWSLIDYLNNNRESYICRFLPPSVTIENYQEVLGKQFLYIGVTEYFQESVDVLAQKLGFRSMKIPEINTSEWNEDIPDDAREIFTENNKLEMAIYRYARENYGNQFGETRFSV